MFFRGELWRRGAPETTLSFRRVHSLNGVDQRIHMLTLPVGGQTLGPASILDVVKRHTITSRKEMVVRGLSILCYSLLAPYTSVAVQQCGSRAADTFPVALRRPRFRWNLCQRWSRWLVDTFGRVFRYIDMPEPCSLANSTCSALRTRCYQVICFLGLSSRFRASRLARREGLPPPWTAHCAHVAHKHGSPESLRRNLLLADVKFACPHPSSAQQHVPNRRAVQSHTTRILGILS